MRLTYAGIVVLAFLALYAVSNLAVWGQTTENALLGGHPQFTMMKVPWKPAPVESDAVLAQLF